MVFVEGRIPAFAAAGWGGGLRDVVAFWVGVGTPFHFVGGGDVGIYAFANLVEAGREDCGARIWKIGIVGRGLEERGTW